MLQQEASAFIPSRPNSRFIPAQWFKDVREACEEPRHVRNVRELRQPLNIFDIPRENGEIEADDFVFEGINPDNLYDTSKVKLKSFTFVGYRAATKADIKIANRDFRERVLNLYKFYAKHDPNIYTKSLGIETAAQKLDRFVKEKDIDLEYFLRDMEEFNVFCVPGTEEYEYRLYKILGESGLPTLQAANYLFDLVKQVKENEVAMYKATHIGNNLNQGFSQLSDATNNVAIATLMSGSSCSGGVIAVGGGDGGDKKEEVKSPPRVMEGMTDAMSAPAKYGNVWGHLS